MPRGAALLATLALALAASPFVGACAAEPDDTGSATCSATEPIECRTPEGALVGCCPESHPVCAANGLECYEWGSGGAGGVTSGGGAPAGGFGGTPGGGGTPNGGGGVPGGGGAPSGGGAPNGGGAPSGGGSGGTSGGSGGTTSGGSGGTSTGGSGNTGGTSCTDQGFEPNETENTATQLQAITDCDGTGSSVSGKLDGKTDVDYSSFWGSDTSGCVVGPVASTTAKVRLCLFAECAGATVSCSTGTPNTSPGGKPGCCVPAGGTVDMSLDCNGWTDDATVFIRVDQGPTNVCTSYTVDYHY